MNEDEERKRGNSSVNRDSKMGSDEKYISEDAVVLKGHNVYIMGSFLSFIF